MFDQLLFNPTNDGHFRLVCPRCGQQDEAEITGLVLGLLSFRGADSLCIECDPEADIPIEYWPVGVEKRGQGQNGGGHTERT